MRTRERASERRVVNRHAVPVSVAFPHFLACLCQAQRGKFKKEGPGAANIQGSCFQNKGRAAWKRVKDEIIRPKMTANEVKTSLFVLAGSQQTPATTAPTEVVTQTFDSSFAEARVDPLAAGSTLAQRQGDAIPSQLREVAEEDTRPAKRNVT